MIFAMAIMIPWFKNTMLDYQGNLKDAVGEFHHSIDIPGAEPVNRDITARGLFVC